MFFSTPHSGADPYRVLKYVVEKDIRAAGFTIND
jgi:hypothetical protein